MGSVTDRVQQGLKLLLGVDLQNHTMTIIDSGNEPFSPTNLPLAAQAVVSVLQHPSDTANKYLTVSSFTTTQNEVLRSLESETGREWTVKHVSSAELERAGDEKKARGDFSFLQYLQLYTFADGAGHALGDEESANELLGLGKEDLAKTLRAELS